MRRRDGELESDPAAHRVAQEAEPLKRELVRDGEHVVGVAHIFASFNDTFVHVTDLSGKETLARVTGTFFTRAAFAFTVGCGGGRRAPR